MASPASVRGLPSRQPVTATSLTAAVVVNKRQASLVLRHYCCKATSAPNTDDAQTASHSSRSRQASLLRAGADSAADADLWLFITLGCAPSPIFLLHSLTLPPSLAFPCSFSSAKLSLATLQPQEGIQLCSAGYTSRAGSTRGGKAVSERRSCALLLLLLLFPCGRILLDPLKQTHTFDFRACHGLRNRRGAWSERHPPWTKIFRDQN